MNNTLAKFILVYNSTRFGRVVEEIQAKNLRKLREMLQSDTRWYEETPDIYWHVGPKSLALIDNTFWMLTKPREN